MENSVSDGFKPFTTKIKSSTKKLIREAMTKEKNLGKKIYEIVDEAIKKGLRN